MWAITIYKNKKWLGNVVNKKANQICVHCLEKPCRVDESQNLERERNQYTNFMYQFYPKLMQMVKKDVNAFGATNCH